MKYIKSTIIVFLLILGGSTYSYSIKPKKEYILTPDSLSWSYEELRISTKDNCELNTWVYHPEASADKNTVIILAYSDAGNMSYWVYFAWTLAKSGYTVVTFDYRGFGKSSNFKINPDNLYHLEFSKDLDAVVQNISNRFKDEKLGIWALSMGTIVTSHAYSAIAEEVDFIIGDGFVTNTANIIERYKKLGKSIILPYPAHKYSEKILKIACPILIFAASQDEITSTKDAHEFRVKKGGRCTVVEYEGLHLRGFQYQIQDKGFGGWYLEQIDSFLVAFK